MRKITFLHTAFSSRFKGFFRSSGFKFFSVLLLVLLLSGKSWGQLVNQDFTSGTVPNAVTVSPISWATNGTGLATFLIANASPITYLGYNSAGGNYVSVTKSTGTINVSTPSFAQTAATTSTLYFSFLLNVPTVATGTDYFSSLSTTFNSGSYFARVFIKSVVTGSAGTGTYNIGFAKASGTGNYKASSPTTLNAGTTYLIVVRYTYNSVSGTDDAGYIWINPTISSEPTTGTAEISDTSGSDGTVLSTNGVFTLRSNTTTQSYKFDGLRVAYGTTSANAWTSLAPAVSYIVTFNSNGGTGSMSNQTSSTAANLTTNSFTRTGYTFTGWNTLSNGTGTAYSDGQSYNFAADLTLYAQWTANSSPVITVNGTINAFANTVINTSSTEQSYTIQGSNLTGDITVTPPAGFEISKSTGTGFVANPSTLTFTPAEVATAQNVYVHFAPTAAQAYSGNITHTSTGATQIDKALSGIGIKAEPTNHASAFTATANTSSQITVTWTDATGGQAPDGYLVKAAIDPASPAAPSDGTAQTDAALVKNIAQGTQSAVFTGLSASTTYNFSIWPYTNSGTAINYKLDGTVPTANVATLEPVSIKWDGEAGTTAWSDPTNWSGNVVPGSTDIVVLDNSLVSGTYSVVLPSGATKTTILKLTITPTLPNNITLTLPVENTYGASNDAGLVVGDNASSTDDIIINDGGILINASGGSTGNGIQVNSLTNGTLRINNGGKFVHKTTRSAAGTSVTAILSTTSGTEKGIYEYDVPGTTYGLGASGRTYGSLMLTRSAGAATYTSSGGSDLTVKGDFTVNTGVTYTTTMTGALNIGGNLTNNGTALTVASSQAVNFNGTTTQTISGATSITLAGATTISNVSTVSIAPNFGLTISGAFTNNGILNLLSTVDGTATLITSGTVSGSGTANVNQTLGADRNWYLSSPVSAAGIPTADNVYYYDETVVSAVPNDSWKTPTGNLAVGKGYIVNPTSLAYDKITFNGTLNSGDQPAVTLTQTPAKSSSVGFNLVGNPYPSYLNANALLNDASNSNVLKTIWYRTNDGSVWSYPTFNAQVGIGVPSDILGLIPPMQAFWVRATANNVSFYFKDGMRIHNTSGSSIPFKAPAVAANQILRLQVAAGSIPDEAVVYFNPNASNGYDAYDSPKMMNGSTSTAPDIYTTAGTEQLVINGMNTIPYDIEIPLYFKANASSAGPFSLSATQMSNFETGTLVYVKNNSTAVKQLISDGTVYTFDATAVGSDPSFSLIFKAPGAITAIPTAANDQNLLVYRNANNQIAVQIKGQLNDSYALDVYNSVGQKLASKQATAGITIMDAPQSGVYFVTIKGNGNNTTKKVVIN